MIKLSRLTDYSVTLLTQMAGEDTKVWAAPQLAEKSGLPLPTVSKILKQLSKAAILVAQRGAAGGYRLARSPDSISVVSIIEAMDGPIAITECANGGDHGCNVERTCPMNGRWNKVNQAIRAALKAVTLADLASESATRARVEDNSIESLSEAVA